MTSSKHILGAVFWIPVLSLAPGLKLTGLLIFNALCQSKNHFLIKKNSKNLLTSSECALGSQMTFVFSFFLYIKGEYYITVLHECIRLSILESCSKGSAWHVTYLSLQSEFWMSQLKLVNETVSELLKSTRQKISWTSSL